MKDKLISIIIPVYKVEPYLKKCVDSVLNQTYMNVEIILVDDGSPDKCPEICDEYAKSDKRIKVIHKKNGGLSDARNYGIDMAKGKYLIFIDSDDYVHPKLVENLYKTAVKHNLDMVFGNMMKVYDNTSSELYANKYNDFNDDIVIMSKPFYYLLYNDYSYNIVPACGKIYKREIFESLRFKKDYINEDEYILLEVLNICNSIGYLNESLYYYYQRPSSITKSLKIDKKHHIAALKNRLLYFEDNDVPGEIKVISAFKYLSLLYQQLYKSNCSYDEQAQLRIEIDKAKQYIMKRKNSKFDYSKLSRSNSNKLKLIKFSSKLVFLILKIKSKYKL